MRRSLSPALAAVALLCCALPTAAQDLVRLELVDRDQGQTLPEYRHRGTGWVAGTPGHRYAVRLTNTTGARVLAVLSVDGVNAVSGETASPGQAGYVLGPWESAEIGGWRKSLDRIAQFVFTDLPDSYAARTGRPDDVGVVGIAVFRERQHPLFPPPPPPPVARAAQGAAPAAEARRADRAMAAAPLGTGHGASEWAPVGQTRFERASRQPDQVTVLRYDRWDTLVALGVVPRARRWDGPRQPQAFPGGFVPDPPRR